jgi:periplasmic protein TonB
VAGVLRLVRSYSRRAPAFGVSLACHLIFFAVLLVLVRQGSRAPIASAPEPDRAIPRMVWLKASGPGGGGGGGGNGKKDPPRRAERPGRDAITVPAAKPVAHDFSKPASVEPAALPSLDIPVANLASSTETLQMGAIGAPPSLTASQGPGDGGGAGTGKGTGDGPGRRSGLGPGEDGNTGGGPMRPGNGVTMPVEIQKGIPRYTSEAMRARIQGAIMVECVVQTSGVCTDIRVKRSFDPAFGLDQEAIKAASQWRFRPGTLRGQAVPVIVTMEIAFALR